MKKILWKSFSKGKKAYCLLWLIVGVILLVLIAAFIAWKKPSPTEADAIAGIGLSFLVVLIVAMFVTVWEVTSEKRKLNKKNNDEKKKSLLSKSGAK